MYIHADSGARICCYMAGSLGAVQSGADLDQVWTEGPITEIREAISKGEVHPFCRGCVGSGRYQHSYIDLKHIERHIENKSVEAEAATVAAK